MKLRVALLLLSLDGFALAQSDPVAAEALFREGRDAMKKGDYPAACPKFAESMRLDASAGALFNLADCEEHLGKLATAWLHWRQVIDMLRATPADDRLPIAEKHAADLAPRLPRLRVRWAGAPVPGAVIKRDGVDLGEPSMNAALPIDPGPHTVEVFISGKVEKTYTVTTSEGRTTDVDVAVSAPPQVSTQPPVEVGPHGAPPIAAQPALPPREAPPSEGSALVPLGWVSAISGGVFLGGGFLLGAGALAQKSTVESQCSAQKVCSPSGASAASTGQALAATSTAFIVIGSVLIAAGVTLVVIGGRSSSARVAASPTSILIEGRF